MQALYVSPEKASGNFAPLVPVLDFEKRLVNREAVQRLIDRRKFCDGYNLDNIYSLWDMTKELNERKIVIEKRRKELSKLVRDLIKSDLDAKEKEDKERKYKLEGIALRDDAKNLRNSAESIEEKLINHFLDLRMIFTRKRQTKIKFILHLMITKKLVTKLSLI